MTEAMIKLYVYTPNSNELSYSGQHDTLDELHACLWRLLVHLKDDHVFCYSAELDLEHRLTRDAQGTWRFADGTPLKGPVVRTYWRVRSVRDSTREHFSWARGERQAAYYLAAQWAAYGHSQIKITRVTVRAKARRTDGTR